MKTKSNIERLLEKGVFVVTSECGPPRGADAEAIRKKGSLLKGVVDAVNVTDNQTSIVRMSRAWPATLQSHAPPRGDAAIAQG